MRPRRPGTFIVQIIVSLTREKSPAGNALLIHRIVKRWSPGSPMKSVIVIVMMSVLCVAPLAHAQAVSTGSVQKPTAMGVDVPLNFRVVELSVEGVTEAAMKAFVAKASGLRLGQQVLVPGDPAFGDAVKALYRLKLFSDVKIAEKEREGRQIRLVIQVKEEPRLSAFTYQGVSEKDQREIERRIPLFPGSRVRHDDEAHTRKIVQKYYETEGYPLADVTVKRNKMGPETVSLAIAVKRGPKVKVRAINISGNKRYSEGRLRGQMKETHTGSWWRFWRKAKFNPNTFPEDLARIIGFYNEEGYFDARIVHDTTYVEINGKKPERVIDITVFEGPRYHIRRVEWEGNTLYDDKALTRGLGLKPGDWYNGKKIETRLFASPDGADIAGLYMNRGYLRFKVTPSVRIVPGDSMDLHFDVVEGEVYTFGDVGISGNWNVKEHVIRRSLATVPGEPFSRAAVQQSVMRLMRLGYFDAASLANGPDIRIDEENRKVNLNYHVEESHRNPLSLGGNYTGALVFQIGLNLNNFSLRNLFKPSAWHPLPSGDGQHLSLRVQATGRNFQQYSLDFTEPWFRHKPNPLGFSGSFAHIADGFQSDINTRGSLDTWSLRTFHNHQLSRSLSYSTAVRYRYYSNQNWTRTLPLGRSHELVFSVGLVRNTLDNPTFPRRGTMAQFSVDLAPHISRVQYHKWRFRGAVNQPLTRNEKLSIGVTADLGFIGSLTGKEVEFQRFMVGGSPFDSQGFDTFYGQDIVYLRGYPSRTIGPRDMQGEAAGGRVMNKYTAELSMMMVQNQVVTMMPYVFFDAANAWSGLDEYRPKDLFRSTGFGLRMTLPMLGIVDFNYGYNLDRYQPLGSHDGQRGWTFQFTIGRTFGF